VSDRPAAMFGSYVDAKWMRGLKVMRVMIDVPIERSNEFLEMFGAPSGTDPVPVAIARLVAEPSGPKPAPEGPKPQEPRTYTRSQIAALKIKDRNFQDWLEGEYLEVWGKEDAHDYSTEQLTDAVLKSVLGIKSKRELDFEGSPAAINFDRIITSFDYRGQV